VWDHVPSADEILQARVQDGWKPTPSSLKDGDRVLGHAACLATSIDAADREAEQ
jgi:hypothetical protein